MFWGVGGGGGGGGAGGVVVDVFCNTVQIPRPVIWFSYFCNSVFVLSVVLLLK